MATQTKQTKEKLEFLEKNFTEKDYNDYINGDISYTSLCEKFECSDYLMATFFKHKNLLKRRSVRKNNIKEDIFDNINSTESAYIFGLYMADGCVTAENKFAIALNEKDVKILNKIKDFISPISKVVYKEKYTNQKTGITTNPMYILCFKSDHISNTLNEYGCGYNKTYLEKSIINIVPREFMWDFIRGYFDGDGCISKSDVIHKHILKNGNNVEYNGINVIFKITSKTRLILDELCTFLNDEGLNFSVYSDRTSFTLATHTKNNLPIIYNHLYSNNSEFYLERKKIKFKEIIDNTEINSEIAKGSESS